MDETETLQQPSKINGQTSEVLDPDLTRWLLENPVLHAALQEARECGRWLVTVHRKVKDSPPDDLAGRAVRCDFPADCLLDAMRGMCRSLLMDEQQARQLDGHQCADKNQWR
jgi:hypothetical protein